MKTRRWTDEQLKESVRTHFSCAATIRGIGLQASAGNNSSIKRHIERLGLDASHWTGSGHLKGKTHSWTKSVPLSSVMVAGSMYNRCALKRRLNKEGILKNLCAICGQLPEWNGKPLVMVLDHINGVNNDNRLENLRLLCPHCNSQQDTFCRGHGHTKGIFVCISCGKKMRHETKSKMCLTCCRSAVKNKKCATCGSPVKRGASKCRKCFNATRKTLRPEKEELARIVWEISSEQVAKKYGVSGASVAKWCKLYGIPKPSRGYWAKQKRA